MTVPATLSRRPARGLERVMLEVGPSQGPDVVVARIEGEISPGVLERATLAIAASQPMLRAAIVGEEPMFEERPLDPSRLQVRILEANPTENQWQTVVAAELERPFDPARGHLFRVTWVREDGGGWLIIAAHHAVVDGASLMRILDHFLTACSGATRRFRRVRSGLTAAAMEHFRAPFFFAPLSWLFRKIWALRIASYQSAPAFAPNVTASVGTALAFRNGSEQGWARLKTQCQSRGVTVGSALMAATAWAVARRIQAVPGSTRVPIDVNVDLRSRARPPLPADQVGFFTGGIQPVARVCADGRFWALAESLQRDVKRQIAWGIPAVAHWMVDGRPYFETLAEVGIDPHAAGGTASLVNVSNAGRYPYEQKHGDLRITEIYGLTGICLTGPALMVWLRFVDGRLCFNAASRASLLDQHDLEAIQDEIASLLDWPPPSSMTFARYAQSLDVAA